MRIAFFIQHYPPYPGGAERQAEMLTAALTQRGQQVFVITTRFLNNLAPKLSRNSLRVCRLPTVTPRVLKLPYNLATGFIAGLSVARGVDLIHAHCQSSFVLGAVLAAKLHRCPVLVKICSMGSSSGELAKIKGHGLGRWLWPLFQWTDLFIVPTHRQLLTR